MSSAGLRVRTVVAFEPGQPLSLAHGSAAEVGQSQTHKGKGKDKFRGLTNNATIL